LPGFPLDSLFEHVTQCVPEVKLEIERRKIRTSLPEFRAKGVCCFFANRGHARIRELRALVAFGLGNGTIENAPRLYSILQGNIRPHRLHLL